MAFTPGVQAAFDWLVDGAPGCKDPVKVITKLMPDLVAGGIPIERFVANVRTLHPHIVARSFFWNAPAGPVQIVERTWADLHETGYQTSPFKVVEETGNELRCHFANGGTSTFPPIEGLRAQGFTDYLLVPFKFMSGTINTTSWATKAPGGFTEAQLDALRFVTRALTRVAETFALMRTAVNLLNTYVGREAGERIWAGHIVRGETESIRCVIWFSDLRGFTSMSDDRSPMDVIAVLNELFDCQVPAIEANGGEVLKFIGDGMLAIFPLDDKRTAQMAGDAAVGAAREAFVALDALNAKRAARNQPALRFGVALHVGEVGYGNIGGANRLDFTAIGPAVNLASRIEGLTGKLEKRVLVSEALAKQLTVPTNPMGAFELKGVAQKQAVFEPG